MKYVLDTNTCIYIINKHSAVEEKFKSLAIGEVGISSITCAELQFGISNSSRPKQNQEALNQFLAPLEILDFPAGACPVYGEARTKLKKSGTMIGPLDLLIGAHALFLQATLVTNNENEFSRIPGLKTENWI